MRHLSTHFILAALSFVDTFSHCAILLGCRQHEHTALHRAAAFGALGVIRVLHSHGGSLEKKNKSKETPLDTAKSLSNEMAVKLLEALALGVRGGEGRRRLGQCGMCAARVGCCVWFGIWVGRACNILVFWQ